MHAADLARRQQVHWLHVDYEPHLAAFYEKCGFRENGLILYVMHVSANEAPAAAKASPSGSKV